MVGQVFTPDAGSRAFLPDVAGLATDGHDLVWMRFADGGPPFFYAQYLERSPYTSDPAALEPRRLGYGIATPAIVGCGYYVGGGQIVRLADGKGGVADGGGALPDLVHPLAVSCTEVVGLSAATTLTRIPISALTFE